MKNKQYKLSRTYEGKEVLCKKCKTKRFRVVTGYPKEKYGVIAVHKDNCGYIKKLRKMRRVLWIKC